jgi:hypothetical protein
LLRICSLSLIFGKNLTRKFAQSLSELLTLVHSYSRAAHSGIHNAVDEAKAQ